MVMVMVRMIYAPVFGISRAGDGAADFRWEHLFAVPTMRRIAYFSCVCRMRRAIEEKEALQSLQ